MVRNTSEANDIVTAQLKIDLSQSQFAAALKISPHTLQQWDRIVVGIQGSESLQERGAAS